MTAARNPNSAGNPQTRGRALALGEAVRTRRKSLGMSQERLAELIGELMGETATREWVSRVENAAHSPTLHRAWVLADALGVPLEDLLREASASVPVPEPCG